MRVTRSAFTRGCAVMAAGLMLMGLGESRPWAQQSGGQLGDADLSARIRDSAAVIRKHLELLKSSDPAIRVAAFNTLVMSGTPAAADLAIETALASEDRTLQALALRAGFRQVRSMVAKLQPGAQGGSQSQAVLQACGDAVQYKIEGYSFENGTFEVRGQDHTGVGQVSGTTVSLTIEYGCSLTGTLQPDRTLSGLVSAPYKKGSLPARITFR